MSLHAYLNDPVLKRNLLVQIRQHEKQDQIVKGTYGEMNGQWRGCAIGCALHSLNIVTQRGGPTFSGETGAHERFPTELGIPIELAYTIDHLFENLPLKESLTFPRRVATAIPAGADLSSVMSALLHWTILDPAYGWIVYAKTADHQAAMHRFAGLVADDWAGRTVSDATWREINEQLDTIPKWAGAWAWARARAWAWAEIMADKLEKLLKEASKEIKGDE